MPRKLTIATGLYPPEIGGPATYTKMLEEVLPAHEYEINVVPYGWVRRYPKVVRHAAYAWKLYQESKDSEVIYALDPVSVGLPASIIARLTQKRFILRVPGDYAWEQAQLRFGVNDRLHDFIQKRYDYGVRTSILCWLESKVAKRAYRVVVPSEYVRFVMEKWGVDTNKVTVIYSALFPLAVTETRESIRAQLAYSGQVILSAGRLVPNKGMLALLEVFRDVHERYPDTTLVIVGDGPDLRSLQNTVDAYQLSKQVRFLGRLSKDALGAAIKGADLFVLNTAHEGLSHQLLEVMDIGVPVVTTDVGGNPELLRDGEDGRLVAYNDNEALKDAIGYCLEHESARVRYVQNARMRSKEFTQEKAAQELLLFLDSIWPKK